MMHLCRQRSLYVIVNCFIWQDDREDDYSERLADLSGIDFSLPHIPRTKNIIATPMKIGFLGLGAMGSGMVTNLLNSGHEVTVWNRTPSSVSRIFLE